MMSWLALAAPVGVAIGLLALFGAPIAFALRLRGFFAAVAAAPAALAIVALSSLLSPLLGLSWGPLVPLALTVACTVFLGILGRWLGPRAAVTARAHRLLVPLGAAALGGLAIAAALVMSLKSPDAVSQTYDANFHLNAVRQILDSGNASPFAMDLSAPGDQVFYPTLWHALVALVAQVTGSSIPLATNALVFVVCTVLWPIGMVALGRAVAGPSVRVSLVSGVLAAAFPNFPLALVGYGVLYPNLLSLAIVPFIVVACMQVLGLGHARSTERTSPGTAWLLLGGAFGASIFAHPNALHITLLWLIAPTAHCVVRAFRKSKIPMWAGPLGEQSRARALNMVGAALALPALALAFAAAWYIGRTSDNPWGGKHGPKGAILDALGMTPHLEGHVWPLTLLFFAGLVIACRRPRLRWAVGSATVLLGVYVIADGFPPSEWRTAILAPWYSDPWRLSALVWLGAFPLAVLGASWLWSVAAVGVNRARRIGGVTRSLRSFAAIAGAVLLLAATQGAGAFAGVQYVSSKYAANEESPLLTPDERALLERLPEHVPESETIINNPWNGGALAYALGDRKVLVPHTGGAYDPRIFELIEGIDDATPHACDLSREFNAQFVLDFGTEYVFEGTPLATPYSPISDIESAPALTEVDREGDAVLYRVDGCK